MILESFFRVLALPYLAVTKAGEWRGWSRVRVAAARMRGARIGHGVKIDRHVSLGGARNIRIGDRVYLGAGVSIVAYDSAVTIGSGTLIAAGCRIISRNHAFRSSSGSLAASGYESKPVTIGAEVWLGYDVIVLPGVTIGDSAVVAAGAVVTRSVDARGVVAGVPARALPASPSEVRGHP